MSTATVSVLHTGVDLDPTAPDPARADLAALAALAPHWLGHPMEASIAVVGLTGSLPVTCVGVDLDEAGADRRLRTTIREFSDLGLDVAAIAYTTEQRTDAVIGYDARREAAQLGRYPRQQTALVRQMPGEREVHRRAPEPGGQWEPIGTTPAEAIGTLDADCHAWGRWGVLDAAHLPLTHLDPPWVHQVPKAQRALARMTATERYHDGLRATELAVEAACLPGPPLTVALGEAVLDCRTLDRALDRLTQASRPRIDVWLWAARLLPDRGHWATGMAGLACSAVGRGAAARMAFDRQCRITDDARTNLLSDAVTGRRPFNEIRAMVRDRAWPCDRSCCSS